MIVYKMLLLRAPNVNNSHILVAKQFNFLRKHSRPNLEVKMPNLNFSEKIEKVVIKCKKF